MQVFDFTAAHVEQATQIARQNYEKARACLPTLPRVKQFPDLAPFAENGLGTAAFEGGDMVGFLCCVPPFKNALGSTGATGVFSPLGTNGVTGTERAKTYARLYQAAGEKWASAGATSHAVCLYAHDQESQIKYK